VEFCYLSRACEMFDRLLAKSAPNPSNPEPACTLMAHSVETARAASTIV